MVDKLRKNAQGLKNTKVNDNTAAICMFITCNVGNNGNLIGKQATCPFMYKMSEDLLIRA